jgi:hypothetical protein
MSLRRKRLLSGAGLAAVAALGALVVVVFWNGGGTSGPEPTVSSPEGIDAYADLDPYAVQFGDTVTARVEVTVDRSRVDPDSIRVSTDFAPWSATGAPHVLRRDGNSTTYLEWRYALRCLERFCTTADESDPQTFKPARVTYTSLSGGSPPPGTRTLEAVWPELLVTARYAPPSASRSTSQLAPSWEADLVSLPPATYRLSPWLIVALLLGGAALLAAVGVVLVVRSRPRAASAAPAPVIRAGPTGTPLEYALALLEDPTRVNGSGDQRRALQLVAEGLVLRGDGELARTARALAWSRPVPQIDETRALARKARATFGRERDAAG